jgi:hypothetical protein
MGPQQGSGQGGRPHGRSLKTQQHAAPEGTNPKLGRHTRTPGRRASRNAKRQTDALIEELPRKEVIQPHLPVRLPCYDFTPITSPTFDGSLPEGLGHRLRVLPAFVV